MLQKSRFFMVMLVALLALGLLVMGCSDGSDDDEEEVDTSYVLTAADTDWVAALGGGDITVRRDGNVVLELANAIDVSSYSKLIVQVATQTEPGWWGGQLGNMDENVQYGYWNSGTSFDKGLLIFDLTQQPFEVEIDEIVYSVMDDPIKVYLE